MSPAAAQSFGSRWARDNLARAGSADELRALDLVLATCAGDEVEASARARRYYAARGPAPHGLKVWTSCRRPDDDEILSSCQDVYIAPLRAHTESGRRLTLVRLPAPGAPDRPINMEALIARWLMILDIRVREEADSKKIEDPAGEVVVVDVGDMKAVHIKQHFRGAHWRDFFYCIRSAHPKLFSEVHVINTHRLSALSLLTLHTALRRRGLVRVHSRVDRVERVLINDVVPAETLPYEYGGREGALQDLSDAWTKKLLYNASWLEEEAERFLETKLKDAPARTRRRSEARIPALTSRGSYPVLKRSRSEKHLRDLDETHGTFRTLKTSDHGFYA